MAQKYIVNGNKISVDEFNALVGDTEGILYTIYGTEGFRFNTLNEIEANDQLKQFLIDQNIRIPYKKIVIPVQDTITVSVEVETPVVEVTTEVVVEEQPEENKETPHE